MARRTIDVDGQTLVISPLEPPPAGERHTAILSISVIDETTGRPPLAPIWARLAEPLNTASVRVVDTSLVGVAGKINEIFSPTLAASQTISVDIGAPRFATRHISVDVASAVRKLTASAGADLTLDSVAGLAVGSRLLLSTPDSAGVEFATITATGPGNKVTLAQVPTILFPVDSVVQPLPADQAIGLHREPILIGGCVLKRSGAGFSGLATADVRVSKIWLEAPPAGAVVAPEPPVPGVAPPPPPPQWDAPLGSIWPPLYADFPAGASVEFEDRPVDAGMTPKTLLDDAAAGASDLRFSDALSLAVGNVIAIDADDSGRREIVEVTNIVLSATVADWVRVTVNHPLALSHRQGCIVRRLSAVVPFMTRALNYDGITADATIFFDATGFTGTHQVRLVDGGPPVRHAYHRLDAYITASDGDGYYRLPPLTRVGKIELAAKDSGSAAKGSVELVPDYTLPETQRDLTVS